jgi:uncharacterized protein YaeQ
MSQGAAVLSFEINLSDNDRGVYESVSLQVAQHKSESDGYLVARVIAYCLELTEGIAFTKGLDEADAPAIEVRDLTGALQRVIEVGTPVAARLHKARKAAGDVAVYCHKNPEPWLDALRREKIHEKRSLRLYEIDRALIDELVSLLQRRNAWDLSRMEGTLYIQLGDDPLTGQVTPLLSP